MSVAAFVAFARKCFMSGYCVEDIMRQSLVEILV